MPGSWECLRQAFGVRSTGCNAATPNDPVCMLFMRPVASRARPRFLRPRGRRRESRAKSPLCDRSICQSPRMSATAPTRRHPPTDRRRYLIYFAIALFATNTVRGFVTEPSHRTPHHLAGDAVVFGASLFLARPPSARRAWTATLALTLLSAAHTLWTLCSRTKELRRVRRSPPGPLRQPRGWSRACHA